jgi:hypothetical protein
MREAGTGVADWKWEQRDGRQIRNGDYEPGGSKGRRGAESRANRGRRTAVHDGILASRCLFSDYFVTTPPALGR